MTFRCIYKTPDGFDDLVMESDEEVLTGLRFNGGRDAKKHASAGDDGIVSVSDICVFDNVRRWLDIYFSGRQPDFTPPYRIVGATPFRKEVVRDMLDIPFGATTTYGNIASKIAKRHGMTRMSAQAVGGAVGWNPICIIIPCHRVMGAHGDITGYGGGINNKIALLNLEMAKPKKNCNLVMARVYMRQSWSAHIPVRYAVICSSLMWNFSTFQLFNLSTTPV